MLDRGVVDDQVDQDSYAAIAGLVHELGEVAQGADPGMDVVVVRDVVAVVLARRGVDGVQPDAGDAQPRQVVEPDDQALEVADAVRVGVLEGLDIQAVDDGFLVPALGHPTSSLARGRLTDI